MMEFIGILTALFSAASWAFGTVAFEKLGKVVPYAGITFLKGVFSLFLMLLLVLICGNLKSISLHDSLILTISGIIGIAIGDSLFFKSLQDLGAKIQVLYFLLGQIVTMVLSFLLLGDILSVNEYLGAIVLLFGVIIVTWGKQEDHPNKIRGVIGGFLSILCFSVSTIMIKYTDEQIDIISASFYRMLAGTIIMTIIGTTGKRIRAWISPLKDKKVLALFLINVLVITVGGFVLSMYTIKNISVSLASVLSTTEPIFVIIFAYLVNKETIKKKEIIGAIISIIGLLFIVVHG